MRLPVPPALRGALRPETLYWLLPFLLFLTVRLFSGFEHLLVGGDQCKYLTLGRTFPLHQVDDHSLFLLHPPALGYTIGAFGLVMPLLSAGLLTTLAYACAAFFGAWTLGRRLGVSPPGMMVGLLFLALDRASVTYDTHVSRVPIMVFSFALALLAYERWRTRPTTRSAAGVVAANAFAHLVSDQALALLACQIVVFALHFDARLLRRAVLLFSVTVLTFLAWPAVRLWVYAHHAHYPAGLDGTIEFTQPIAWASLLQPHYLAFTRAHTGLFMNVAPSLADYDLQVLLRRPLDVLLVHPVVAGALASSLAVAAFVRRERRTRALELAALSVLLLLPASLGLNEWHGMGFVVPFSLLLGLGATELWERARAPARWLQPLCAAACVPLMAGWLLSDPPALPDPFRPTGGTHFLFRREPVTRAQRFSRLLRDLPPEDGIMAPVGLTPELVYLTGKRVVALPFDPRLIDRFVREYRITRIVLSDETLAARPTWFEDQFTTALSTRLVLADRERFQLLATEEEGYPALYPPNTFMLLKPRDAPR
jgi:hypothetical protein